MTFKTDDRVFETSVTTGTGTYALDGAQVGFATFAGMGANNRCPYFATDDTNWEVGIGTVLTGPNRLARTTILRSSNANAAVNWGAGTRKIRCGLPAAMGLQSYGMFRKADPTTVAFVKTGAFTISTQAAAIYIEVDGVVQVIPASTAVTMPGSPAAGTDYAIWAKTDGTLECTSNHVTPPTADARRIGGFHYAPGGNATGVAGGDATPAINAYSIWDLKFRPACPDPRGMTLVADGFWADIYLLGVDHPTNGSSKYNVTIADGSSPPKIPAKFGGNGSTAYAGGNWWDMGETLRSFGKRHPTYDEFAALAYGVLESYSIESDPTTTGLVAGSGAGGANLDHTAYKYTSKWGVIQATGNMYIWGANLGGPYNATAAWQADTGGRGSDYNLPNAVLLGGNWGNAASAGSRCSIWGSAPPASSSNFGARGVCDHLQLD